MAPTPARTFPAHLLRLGVIAAVAVGCTAAPPDRTEVSQGTAPPPSAQPPSAEDSSPTGPDTVPSPPSALPDPPDLSGTTIDCHAVDGPCQRGDDPELDHLWDACADGAGGACDRLYYDSGFDTRYEQFGNTCGDRGLTVPCPRQLEGTSA